MSPPLVSKIFSKKGESDKPYKSVRGKPLFVSCPSKQNVCAKEYEDNGRMEVDSPAPVQITQRSGERYGLAELLRQWQVQTFRACFVLIAASFFVTVTHCDV